jgi:hypothetical protein
MNKDETVNCPACGMPQQFPAHHLIDVHGWTPEEVDEWQATADPKPSAGTIH